MAEIIYFSHGGGPLPLLGEQSHRAMISFMKALPGMLKKPKAILVVSAHWEEKIPTVISNENPALLYDYIGFPKQTYSLQYPVPDNREIAEKIQQLSNRNNMPVAIDTKRGLDHGVFVPLLLMYPQADIPVTQLSLVRGLDPEVHIAMGNLLTPLMEEDWLIIGSGFSFHNMRAFDWDGQNLPDDRNDAFQDWLTDVCTGGYSRQEREEKLLNWQEAPHARYCHPREEHLLPLHVCCGMAQTKGTIVFDNYILGKRAIGVKWM